MGSLHVSDEYVLPLEFPEELASYCGPEFTSAATRQFLASWDVHRRLPSVAYPHSNCRAEIGVKTIKRLIADNTDLNGDLNTDALQRSMLQCRNTPGGGYQTVPCDVHILTSYL